MLFCDFTSKNFISYIQNKTYEKRVNILLKITQIISKQHCEIKKNHRVTEINATMKCERFNKNFLG